MAEAGPDLFDRGLQFLDGIPIVGQVDGDVDGAVTPTRLSPRLSLAICFHNCASSIAEAGEAERSFVLAEVVFLVGVI